MISSELSYFLSHPDSSMLSVYLKSHFVSSYDGPNSLFEWGSDQSEYTTVTVSTPALYNSISFGHALVFSSLKWAH